jgi:hypothetical protein
MSITGALLLLATLWALAYVRAGYQLWIPLLGLALAILTISGQMGEITAFGVWSLYLLSTALERRLSALRHQLPLRTPSDRTAYRAAQLLLALSEARDRLTAGVYLTRDPTEQAGRLELALATAVAAAPLKKTLAPARHSGTLDAGDLEAQVAQALRLELLSPAEAELLREAERLRDQVIAVDAFTDYGRSRPAPVSARRPSRRKEPKEEAA